MRGRAAIVTIALVLLVLLTPVLYVLSIGPAVWLYDHDYITQEAYITFYAPVHALIRSNSHVDAWLRWYSGFWEGRSMQPVILEVD